jgi:hypothetical protein
MAKNKLLCFECFHEHSPHEVEFRCVNTDKGGSSGCALEMDSKRNEMLPHAFRLHGFLRVLASLFRDPLQCPCPRCGVVSTKRICPHCHRTFETGRGQLDEHIIAVVGNSRAGKSHYFTVLVERVLQGAVGHGFKAHILSADPETTKLYGSEYSRYLFHEHQVIPPTTIDEKRLRRLVFRLSLSRGPKGKKIQVFLVFYDIAGESLGDIQTKETNATRFLWSSSGIIYLANPREVQQWDKFLEGRCLPSASPVDLVYGGIETELRRNKMWPRPKKLPIPLALCVSQFDRFRAQRDTVGLREDLFDPAASPIQDGRIDLGRLDNESETIRDFMDRTYGGAGNLARTAEDDFAAVRFFAVSALGDSPKGENQEVREVSPCRVEAPFFWILYRLGLLDGSRR